MGAKFGHVRRPTSCPRSLHFCARCLMHSGELLWHDVVAPIFLDRFLDDPTIFLHVYVHVDALVAACTSSRFRRTRTVFGEKQVGCNNSDLQEIFQLEFEKSLLKRNCAYRERSSALAVKAQVGHIVGNQPTNINWRFSAVVCILVFFLE